MTFVDIFLYIFICIVWLRFVNHLLNYYLLTYLLTIMSVCRDIERNYAPCGLRGYSVSWLDVVKGTCIPGSVCPLQ